MPSDIALALPQLDSGKLATRKAFVFGVKVIELERFASAGLQFCAPWACVECGVPASLCQLVLQAHAILKAGYRHTSAVSVEVVCSFGCRNVGISSGFPFEPELIGQARGPSHVVQTLLCVCCLWFC